MRKLTIIRKKRFVACLMKVTVYLETKNPEDILLDKIPCKKIGTLRNGGTITFEVPNEDVDVFVSYDWLSPDIYKVKYHLSSGEEDKTLYTHSILNPIKGNPFVIREE